MPQRKEILRNHRVTISLLELAPREATPMHRHDRDMLAVFADGGRTRTTVVGAQGGTSPLQELTQPAFDGDA